jgi:hypothetical protein
LALTLHPLPEPLALLAEQEAVPHYLLGLQPDEQGRLELEPVPGPGREPEQQDAGLAQQGQGRYMRAAGCKPEASEAHRYRR